MKSRTAFLVEVRIRWCRCVALLCALAAFVPACCADGAGARGHEMKLFVATDGNDSWSGKLPAPNPDKTDGPFATITRARDAIRERKSKGQLRTPVRVLVREGTYYLKETFTLGPQDSGTQDCPITYASYPGEKAILSGGRVLTGWKPYRGKIYSCSLEALGLKGLRFRQLFYRGERQIMARHPNMDPVRPRTGGFLYYVLPTGEQPSGRVIHYQRGALPRKWVHLRNAEVLISPGHGWGSPSVPVASIDVDKRVITLARGVGHIREGNPFHFQNVLEELDAPGEWYLDARKGTVYFWPPDDGLASHGALAPAMQDSIVIEGDLKKNQFAEHLKLSHLGLECCERHCVVLRAARRCGIIGCTVLKVGHAGILIDAGSSFCRVAGNDVFYPGGHAIAMYYSAGTPTSCRDNVITNNYAHHCGEIHICSFGWGSGICISGHRTVLSHNLVHDTAYSAVNHDGSDHVIEYNHIHHVSLRAADCDGIYGWIRPSTKAEASGGTVVRFNRVHDVVGCTIAPMLGGKSGEWKSPSQGFGIRCDDYLSDTTIYGNLVYRCSVAPVCLHGGWRNTVENNILVDGAVSQLRLNTMRRDDPLPSRKGLGGRAPGPGKFSMSHNVVRRNIMYYTLPNDVFCGGSHWEDCIVSEMDRNLIWHMGLPIRVKFRGWPREGSWQRWLAAGRDTHSLVADPLFVDPKKDDYRLRPQSPAFKLGFKPLPIEKMGLVKDAERASWPVLEDTSKREAPMMLTLAPPQHTVGRAYRKISDIVIDGRIDAREWGEVVPPRALAVERLPDGTVSARKHRALVQWDDDNLYVAAIVNAAAAPSAAAEMVLQAVANVRPEAEEVFVLRGRPSGKLDCSAAGAAARMEAVEKAAEYATHVAKEQWTCEWHIPLSACGVALYRIDEFRFNVRVCETNGRPLAAWVARSIPAREGPAAAPLRFRPAVPMNAANLLVNGDFEDGDNKPAGWEMCDRITGDLPDGAKKPKCLCVKEGRDGSRCLKLEGLDANAMRVYEYWWAQQIHAPAPGLYVMSYEIRTDALVKESHHYKPCFYAEGWARPNKGKGQSKDSDPNRHLNPNRYENRIREGRIPCWTRKECLLDVNANVGILYLIFGVRGVTGTIWIDNVRLEKCSP